MDKITYVEEKINNKIIHDGINATEFLLTIFYENNIVGKTNNFKVLAKKIIARIMKRFKIEGFLNGKSCKYKNKKYVYIQMFDVDDSRHFTILDNLIRKMIDKTNTKDKLIITNNKKVASYYRRDGIDVLVLKFPKCIGLKKTNINLNFEENLLINKCIYVYEKAKRLFIQLDTKVIFTTQDFHIYDQIFTKAANAVGIISITHQHGMIPYPSPGLFRYIYSSFIMVWGKSSYDTLEKYIAEQRIILSGTDKFNYLLKAPNNINRNSLTVALNPINEKINRKIIYNIFKVFTDDLKKIEGIDSLIVKLHPSLNKQYYKEIIQEIIKFNNFKVDYEIFTNNNYTVLYRTRIFVGYLTTISLEAMIAGCSVIELNLETCERKTYDNRLFKNIPESIVCYKDIRDELVERLKNYNYNYEIMLKQNRIIKHEICDFTIKRELLHIDSIVSKLSE